MTGATAPALMHYGHFGKSSCRGAVQFQTIGVFTDANKEVTSLVDDRCNVGGVIRHCHERKQKLSSRYLRLR
jgi:hypothetical protein